MEKDQIVSILRAIVTSRKDTTENDIRNGFREIEGYEVPYKKFGFNRLDDFLRSSSEFILIRNGRDTFIKAKLSQDTAHISRLVAEQNSSKRKKSRSGASRRPSSYAVRNMRSSSSAYSNAYSMAQSQRSSSSSSNNNGPRFGTRPMINRIQPLLAKVIPVPKSIRIDKQSSQSSQLQNSCVSTSIRPPGRTFNAESGQISTVNDSVKKLSNDTKVSNIILQQIVQNSATTTKPVSKSETKPIASSQLSQSMPYKLPTLCQKTAKLPTTLTVNVPATKPLTNGNTTVNSTTKPNEKTNLLSRRLENCQKPVVIEKIITEPIAVSVTNNVSVVKPPSPPFNQQSSKSKLGDRLLRIQNEAKITQLSINNNESSYSSAETISPDSLQSTPLTSSSSAEFVSPIIEFNPLPPPNLELITHTEIEANDFVTKLANYCIAEMKTVPQYKFLKIRKKDNRINCKIEVTTSTFFFYCC